MRRALCVACLLLALLQAPAPVRAAQRDPLDDLYAQGMGAMDESLPDSMRGYLAQRDLSSRNGVFDAFLGAANKLLAEISSQLKLPLTMLGSVLAVLAASSLAGASGILQDNAAGGLAANIAVSLASSLAVSAGMAQLIEGARRAVDAAGAAVTDTVPVYAGLAAASGGLVSGSLYGFSVSLVGAASSTIISGIVLPLSGILIGLGLVSGLTDSLQSLCDGLRKAAIWSMGLLTSCFVGVLSIQGKVSAGADTALLRTARFVASSAVPIIGSAVSEAASSVWAGARLMRSTLGSAGILVIVCTMLPQIAVCALSGVSLSLCAIFADITGLSAPRRCLLTLKSAVDILTAALTFHFIALIVCVAVMIGSGG
ncbi:MAG: hypothetical protein VB021_07590 [Oscillospiraceae bacterium]|nr:hypothetical protein [Oscillospiraceae bacterium]